MVGFYGNSANPELRVYLATPETFSLSKAKHALSAIQNSALSTPQPKTIQARPKKNDISGSDLLAGVRRDVQGTNNNRSPNSRAQNPKPTGGQTSGSALLAGIRRDIEAPEKARAKKRAAEKQAYIERAIKTAPLSGPYPMPVILEDERASRYVVNWVDKENDLKVAKDANPHSPCMATYNINYKLGESEKKDN